MNIIEVSKKENIGKVYEIFIDGENKGKWEIEEIKKGEFEFFNVEGKPLDEIYFISQIARMEFEEVIDWSKVPVDTKLLVSSDGKDWYRRHFAEYKDGKVYCFNSGTTSFTAQGSEFPSGKVSWEYVKLYEE